MTGRSVLPRAARAEGVRTAALAKGQVTRRQKDVARLLREKKQVPPPARPAPARKGKKP